MGKDLSNISLTEIEKSKRAVKDLIIILITAILILIISFVFHLVDRVIELLNSFNADIHPADEILIDLIFLLFAFMVFSWRRWKELKKEIAERIRAEEALGRKEKHQALVIKSLPMVFYTARIDDDMATTWISEQVKEITGFSSEQFVTDSVFWQNHLYPDDKERAVREYGTVLDKNYVHTQYRWLCADGTYRWFSDHIVLARDEENKPVEIVGIWRDITEGKDADEALRQSELKYRRLHNTMVDGYVYVDMDGVVKDCNQSYQQMIGYTFEELAKLTYIDLTPEKWHEYEKKIVREQILQKGYSEVYEKEYRKKDGTVIQVELRAFLIQNDSGENEGMWAIVRDITERKSIEAEREKLVSELQDALANIKTLSGLIPICSSCKKIRDDKGYWSQIEKYVMQHSDAKFTHGFCPECTEKYFPQWKKENKD